MISLSESSVSPLTETATPVVGTANVIGVTQVISAPKFLAIPTVGTVTVTPGGRFNVGDSVRSTGDLNVRGGPGLGYSVIGTMLKGTKGQVLSGPVYADSYAWWNINYDVGVTGWSAGNWLELTPPPSPPPHDFSSWAEAATGWAEQRIGSEKWSELCLRFVANAFMQEEDKPAGWVSALEAARELDRFNQDPNGWLQAPRGALIFFDEEGSNPCGHVGIYLGDGSIIHAYGVVTINTVEKTLEKQGVGSYLGWTYPPETWRPTLEENQPPYCSIELQKDGIEINEIDVGEFFDIYVGDSTDDTGIKKVRFSSYDSQDDIPSDEWSEWYKWDASSGDWYAETKIKRWSFATGGAKEVWVEVKDDMGKIAECFVNIYAVAPMLVSVKSIGSFIPVYKVELWVVPPDQIVTAKIADQASLPIEVKVTQDGLPVAGANLFIQENLFPLGITDENGIVRTRYPITHPTEAEDFEGHIRVEVDSFVYLSDSVTLYSSHLLGTLQIQITDDEARWYPLGLLQHYLLQPGVPARKWLLGLKMIDLLAKIKTDLKDYSPKGGDMLHFEAFEYTAYGVETVYAVHLTIDRGGVQIYDRTQWTDKYELVEPIILVKVARNAIACNLASPANLWVTDPIGLHAGINPETGELVFEFSAAFSVTDEVHQIIVIPEPLDGEYKFNIIGTQEGSYEFISSSIVETGHVTNTFTATNIPTAFGVTHQYTIDWDALSEGKKGVIIKIDSDSDGIFEQTINADATLQPPMSEAGGPYEGDEGSPINFDASDSHDLDGTIALYEWDFDGDGTYDASSTSTSSTFTWGDDYTGTVTLRVTDDEGLTSIDTAEVKVDNFAPIVEAGPDQTTNEGDPAYFSGSFIDTGPADTHNIKWSFGDGATAFGTLTPTHCYGDNGVYTATLTVTDDDGGAGITTLIVTVNNVAPTVEAGEDQTVYSGDAVSFSGFFTDPGSIDTHIIVWDFDDGTGVEGILTPVHVYFEAKKYMVTLTVTDDDGGEGCDTITVTVKRIPVPIDIKPGSFPNPINPKSKGVIPLAILNDDTSDPYINPALVDVSKVTFGPKGAKPVHWAFEDVDEDGDIDIILHFRTQETGIQEGDTSATINAELTDGRRIIGEDSVTTVPPKKGKDKKI